MRDLKMFDFEKAKFAMVGEGMLWLMVSSPAKSYSNAK
jgi:hypothetical protein